MFKLANIWYHKLTMALGVLIKITLNKNKQNALTPPWSLCQSVQECRCNGWNIFSYECINVLAGDYMPNQHPTKCWYMCQILVRFYNVMTTLWQHICPPPNKNKKQQQKNKPKNNKRIKETLTMWLQPLCLLGWDKVKLPQHDHDIENLY